MFVKEDKNDNNDGETQVSYTQNLSPTWVLCSYTAV
jgi:hypothetical protein